MANTEVSAFGHDWQPVNNRQALQVTISKLEGRKLGDIDRLIKV
jgi:hypothetical protein